MTSRTALAGNAAIDWHAYGNDGSFVSTPKSHHFATEKVTVSSSSGGLIVRREGGTWEGDFLPGDWLMTQPYQSDNFIVAFKPAVAGLGTQIDPGGEQSGQPPYTGRFVAKICLYGANGTFLGEVQRASTANANETGSAKFLGARSSGPLIHYATFLVSGVTSGFTVEGDLAMNEMDLVTAPATATEPPSADEAIPAAVVRASSCH